MKEQTAFKRILIAVDHEGHAHHALVRGLELARSFGSEVRIIHATPLPPPALTGLDVVAMASKHAEFVVSRREAVLRDVEKARKDLGGRFEESMEEQLAVSAGHPVAVILEAAKAMGAELILLGRRDKHPLFGPGSTARAVLSRSSVPVWTQAGPVTPVRSILVPVDFSENSQHALGLASRLARRFQATLEVLHCHVPHDFAYGAPTGSAVVSQVVEAQRAAAQKGFEEWMNSQDIGSTKVRRLFVEGDVVDEITALSKQVDLVAMGSHGRTGLSRFLLGSVAYTTLQRVGVPVLVVPNASRTWILDDGAKVPQEAEAAGAR